MPSILVWGYKLKQLTKLNVVCFVQHEPYYENNILKFKGLSNKDIEKIKEIYDVVIGINIIYKYISNNIKYNEDRINYKNILYYATKILCCGFTYYEKILYGDASIIITRDISQIFDCSKSSFLHYMGGFDFHLMACIILIIPQKYYISKILYLLKNYYKLFNDFSDTSYNIDEFLLYYTIYPHWGERRLNYYWHLIGENYIRKKYFDNYKNTSYSIELYGIKKPFRSSLDIKETERDLFNLNHLCYYTWDLCVSELIKKYSIKEYFKYIKTFRYTKFSLK
jgi:hypothetical protein